MFQTTKYFSLIAALLFYAGIGHAEEAAPAFAATQNIFDIPFEADNRVLAEALKHEDLASAYNLAHLAEQSRYAFIYNRKYSSFHPVPKGSLETIHFVEPDPFNVWLPHDRDSDGHPLWFDGENGFLSLKNITAGLFYDGLYENLDRLYDTWNKASERTANGQWKLRAFQMPVPYYDTVSEWEDTLKRIKSWQEKSPKSIAAAIFEANYWFAYAEDARGDGYANAISEESWHLFRERLLKAKQVLEKNESYAGKSPLWGDLMISTAALLGYSKGDLIKVFNEANKKNPEYISDYITASYFLSPKWGGGWDLFDSFVRDVVGDSKIAEGATLYARLYWYQAQKQEDPNIFKYTNVSWDDMKPSFEAMTRLYPHSAKVLNAFASFACMANDKATFQTLRFRIKTVIVPSQWYNGYSLDLCEHKFALQPL